MAINNEKLHQGFTLWFTGLPSSGKSTLADEVALELKKRGLLVERLDGDLFRKTISKDLGFSPQDIATNIERAAFVAHLLTKNGVAVLTSFVSPFGEGREKARKEIGNFVEVYVKCPLEECIKKDPKGNYKKALAGEIKNFIGLDITYQEPQDPEIIVETNKEDLKTSSAKVIAGLEKLGYLR